VTRLLLHQSVGMPLWLCSRKSDRPMSSGDYSTPDEWSRISVRSRSEASEILEDTAIDTGVTSYPRSVVGR